MSCNKRIKRFVNPQSRGNGVLPVNWASWTSTALGWIAWLILAAWGVVAVSLAQSVPPNIIMLLTDDQRWDTLGVSGNRIIQTPHLDRLGQAGAVFDHMFVTTSICATSRASIFTGQYARRHGIWDFRTGLSERQLSESYLGVLRQAGYRLGFIGKWGVGAIPGGLLDFDRAYEGQGDYWFREGSEDRHLTEWMGDRAVQFLDEASADPRPFCLSVSFKSPHIQDSYDVGLNPFPYAPETSALYEEVRIAPPPTASSDYFDRLPPFLQNSENRMRWAVRFWGPERYQESVKGYYRLISGVDSVVGRIRAKLESLGRSSNTVILFTGDNGFYLGEFGLAGKWLAHEPSIRVPLIIYDPRTGRAASGRHLSELVLNIDLAPTIIDLAGQSVPRAMQGRSLLPLLYGEKQDWRESFFYEHLFEHPRIPRSEGVRTGRWKYIRYLDSDPLYEEVYDLEADPLEERNLARRPDARENLLILREKWQSLRRQAMAPQQ